MMTEQFATFKTRFTQIRGTSDLPPIASVIVPVNAQTDLERVAILLQDLTRYQGKITFEVILTINNYAPDEPPTAIADYQAAGIIVDAVPDLRRQGEAPGFTARIHGLRRASSEIGILFDADCRIPNPTALIDWYVAQLQQGAHVAYTHVGHYEVPPGSAVQARILSHHFSRWIKRTLLHIPTTRGSNYTVLRSRVLELYDAGYLADEMNVGPTVKAMGGTITYSGRRPLRVLTSGRYLTRGWGPLLRYLGYRLRYNLKVLPVRSGVAKHTGRS